MYARRFRGERDELGVKGAELASKEAETHHEKGLMVGRGAEEKTSEIQESSQSQEQKQKQEPGHEEAVKKQEQNTPEQKVAEPSEHERHESQSKQHVQSVESESAPNENQPVEAQSEFPCVMETKSQTHSAAFDQEAGKPAEEPQEDDESASKGPKFEDSDTEHQEKSVEHDPSTEPRSHNRVEDQRQSEKNTSPKKKKMTLNEDTVKHIPERTSRIIQSYRTNEWAKHLDDAGIPEPPPIQPIEEEPETPIETEQTAAPVNVNELLQTPLNAQPPPTVENFVAAGKEPRSLNEEGARVFHDSQLRQRQVDVSRSNSNQSQPAIVLPTPTPNLPQRLHSTQPAPAKEQQQQQDSGSPANHKQPKWKGPLHFWLCERISCGIVVGWSLDSSE